MGIRTMTGWVARSNIVGADANQLAETASGVVDNDGSKSIKGARRSSDLEQSLVCSSHPVMASAEANLVGEGGLSIAQYRGLSETRGDERHGHHGRNND